MNGLTPELAAAQRSLSPLYTLAVRAGPRATAWGTGGAPWQVRAAFPGALAGWNGQSIATTAAVLNGGVLRAFFSWRQGALVTQWVAGAELDQPAAWSGNALVSAATFVAAAGIDAPRPALVAEGGRVHLYYLLPDGNIYLRISSDGGASWGGAASVYAGGDAEGDLSACHFAADDLHLLHFSTRSDVVRMRGASRKGNGAWNVWPLHGAATGWVAAGIVVTGERTATLLAWARTPAPYTHYLGAVGCTLNAAGALAARDSAVDILWMVSGDAAIRPARHCVGQGLGGWLHTCQEQSAGRAYLCVGGVTAGTCRLEEPAPVTANTLPTAPLERHVTPLDMGSTTLLVGLACVYTSVHATGDVVTDGDSVIEYTLAVRAGGGGTLTLRAPAGSALASVHAGWGLWLTRRCTKGAHTGAATLGLRVVRVERHAQEVRLWAVDAVGLLAATVARRPLQFAPYAHTAAGAVARLAAWAGLDAVCSDVGGSAPLMQWSGGEDGLSALRRLLRAQAVTIGSRAAEGARPQLRVGARASASLESFGAGGHPLIAHTQVDEARAPQLVVVHGLAVRAAPEEGEEWALAADAAANPMLRARPLYILNRNLDAAAQANEAAARLAQIGHAPIAGWIDMQAHLALEVDDCIAVEGETVYVQHIVEHWDRRRLVQRVEYGR